MTNELQHGTRPVPDRRSTTCNRPGARLEARGVHAIRRTRSWPTAATLLLAVLAAATGCCCSGGDSSPTELVGGAESGLQPLENPGPLETVEDLDLDRYLGSFYEYARYPNRFENGLVGVRVDYLPTDEPGRLAITNHAHEDALDGEVTRRTAEAWFPDPDDPTRWRVRFSGLLASMFPVDYWIIARADDYSWALVGQPDRKNLWVVTRRPVIDEATWRTIQEAVVEDGYDPRRLERVLQPADGPVLKSIADRRGG